MPFVGRHRRTSAWDAAPRRHDRGVEVSVWTVMRRRLTCWRRGHVWSAWWWVRALETECRVCARCGRLAQRASPP